MRPSADIVYGTAGVDDRPVPGASKLMTRKSARSSCSGSQRATPAPRPLISSTGGPSPRTVTRRR